MFSLRICQHSIWNEQPFLSVRLNLSRLRLYSTKQSPDLQIFRCSVYENTTIKISSFTEIRQFQARPIQCIIFKNQGDNIKPEVLDFIFSSVAKKEPSIWGLGGCPRIAYKT